MQQAFAAAVAQVLQRQSAALQQLEQQQACSWVQTVAVGGTPGRRFHGRGPSLLQVALHTRRLQLQLRSLADLCWCSLAAGADGSGNAGIASAASGPGLDPQPAQPELGGSWLWQQGFPAGTELLDYLYRRANEAGTAHCPSWQAGSAGATRGRFLGCRPFAALSGALLDAASPSCVSDELMETPLLPVLQTMPTPLCCASCLCKPSSPTCATCTPGPSRPTCARHALPRLRSLFSCLAAMLLDVGGHRYRQPSTTANMLLFLPWAPKHRW